MKKRLLMALIPAIALVAACSNTDTSSHACDTAKDCPNSTSKTYVCKNNVCVDSSKENGENGGNGNNVEYEEIKTDKYCDLAYECKDGSEAEFKCVDKKCVKLVPKDPEKVDPDAKTCQNVLDCKDDSGIKYDCVNNRCQKMEENSGNKDPIEENTGKKCADAVDCNDGSGSKFKCEDGECIKIIDPKPDDKPTELLSYCGDGKIDPDLNEVCDNANLDGKTCKSLDKGYYAGTLSCSKTCLEFNETKCEECDPMDSQSHPCGEGKTCKDRHCVPISCGDNKIDAGEICDGSDLGGKTCTDLNGFAGGTLKCSSTCFFDTSECQLDTGNKPCESDDDCAGGQTCVEKRCKSPQLECDITDNVNKKCPDGKVCENNKCVDARCGDSIKNQASEQCDGSDFGTAKCADFEGFESGFLSCTSDCKIDTSKCIPKSGESNPESKPDCEADNDCLSGEQCVSGKCVKATPGDNAKVPHLVISQVYAGGGTDGATYKSKYLQILNATGSTVDLNGWSIQYAAATSGKFSAQCSFNEETKLLNNRTMLVELFRGEKGDASIPNPDFSCPASGKSVQIATDSGIVVLLADQTKLTTTDELKKSAYVDGVGYGNANWAEGTAAPKLSKTTELIRKSGGCTDTDDNSVDFETRDAQLTNGTLPVTCK